MGPPHWPPAHDGSWDAHDTAHGCCPTHSTQRRRAQAPLVAVSLCVCVSV
jgi:hypothetical protein